MRVDSEADRASDGAGSDGGPLQLLSPTIGSDMETMMQPMGDWMDLRGRPVARGLDLDETQPNMDGESRQYVDWDEARPDQGDAARNAPDFGRDGSRRHDAVETVDDGAVLEAEARPGTVRQPGQNTAAGIPLNSCGSQRSGLDVIVLEGNCATVSTAIERGCNVVATAILGGCNVVPTVLLGVCNVCVNVGAMEKLKLRAAAAP